VPRRVDGMSGTVTGFWAVRLGGRNGWLLYCLPLLELSQLRLTVLWICVEPSTQRKVRVESVKKGLTRRKQQTEDISSQKAAVARGGGRLSIYAVHTEHSPPHRLYSLVTLHNFTFVSPSRCRLESSSLVFSFKRK
jgi:hypothetical protein